jgi:hypothetical protein
MIGSNDLTQVSCVALRPCALPALIEHARIEAVAGPMRPFSGIWRQRSMSPPVILHIRSQFLARWQAAPAPFRSNRYDHAQHLCMPHTLSKHLSSTGAHALCTVS